MNSFQLQNDSMLSMHSSYYNTNVPLPVSQITIRSMPKMDASKPLKPRTPKTSLNGDSKLGRWSPIKITPMRTHKLFEVKLIIKQKYQKFKVIFFL